MVGPAATLALTNTNVPALRATQDRTVKLRSMPASPTLVTTGEAALRHPRDLNVCVLPAGLDQLALIISMIVLQIPVVMEELAKT